MECRVPESYLVGPGGALEEPRCLLSSGRAAMFGGTSSLILGCAMQSGPKVAASSAEEPFPGPLGTGSVGLGEAEPSGDLSPHFSGRICGYDLAIKIKQVQIIEKSVLSSNP